jgi:hypothetical protein
MFGLVREWEKSGLSQAAWCRSHQIPYQQFNYWAKRYKEVVVPEPSEGVSSRPAFISLEVSRAADVTCYAEVVWPDGRRILFHQGVDACYLKTLLS